MRFAIISETDDIVQSILTVVDLESLALNVPDGCYAMPCEDGGVEPRRWAYREGAFVALELAPSPPLRKLFTFNEWVDLFTLEEQVAIVTATMADPMAKLIYDRAQSASGSIDPTDPRTLQGIGYLVSRDYISQAAFDRITGAPG